MSLANLLLLLLLPQRVHSREQRTSLQGPTHSEGQFNLHRAQTDTTATRLAPSLFRLRRIVNRPLLDVFGRGIVNIFFATILNWFASILNPGFWEIDPALHSVSVWLWSIVRYEERDCIGREGGGGGMRDGRGRCQMVDLGFSHYDTAADWSARCVKVRQYFQMLKAYFPRWLRFLPEFV